MVNMLSWQKAPEVKIARATARRLQPSTNFGTREGLYNTARWRKLRAYILKRDYFTCQLCGATGAAAGTLVCDHVRGHPPDEDEEMFWRGPFQCVCEHCHNTQRLAEDREQYKLDLQRISM